MSEFASRDEIIWAMEGDRRGWDLRKKTGGMVREFYKAIQRGDRLAAATREGLIYQLRQVLDTLGGAASFEYGPEYEIEYEVEWETEYGTMHDTTYEIKNPEGNAKWEAFYRVAIHALEAMEPADGKALRRLRKPDLGRVLSKAQCLGLVDFSLNGETVKQFLFKALCICLLTSGAIETLDEWERKQKQEKRIKELNNEAAKYRTRARVSEAKLQTTTQ